MHRAALQRSRILSRLTVLTHQVLLGGSFHSSGCVTVVIVTGPGPGAASNAATSAAGLLCDNGVCIAEAPSRSWWLLPMQTSWAARFEGLSLLLLFLQTQAAASFLVLLLSLDCCCCCCYCCVISMTGSCTRHSCIL